MKRIEDEVLRDLRLRASAGGGLVRAAAHALESEFSGEEDFVEQIAEESGGLGGFLGGLWNRAKQLLGRSPPPAPPTLRSAVLLPAPPPAPAQPPTPAAAPPSDQQLARWLAGGLVPRGSAAAKAPPTLRSPTFPSQPPKPGNRRESADVFEAVLEAAIESDAFHASVPVLAGVALKRAIPQVSQLPALVRGQLVAASADAMRMLAQRSTPHDVRAMPGLLRILHQVTAQRGQPLRTLPQAIPRQAARLADRPDLIARFARADRGRPS
ncbi:MAG TPA: hypothetical protein VF913_13705 [Xanthobacteraceae bacterium]